MVEAVHLERSRAPALAHIFSARCVDAAQATGIALFGDRPKLRASLDTLEKWTGEPAENV